MLDLISYNYNSNSFFTYYIWSLIFIFGLVIGSFLNVVGLRLLSGENIVFPSSKCPNCNTKLKWYDNIPVLAYLLLKGKCRYCQKKISIQYPIVEFLTGTTFLLLFLKFGFTLETLLLFILAASSIVMCITDFKEQVVFDIISMPLIPIGLIYSCIKFNNETNEYIQFLNFNIPETIISSIIGITVAFLIFEGISLISNVLIKHRAFGEGDTIIAMAFAAWLGLKSIIYIILLAILIQTIFTLPIMLMNLFKNKDKIAILGFSLMLLSLSLPFIMNSVELFQTPSLSIIGIILTMFIALTGVFMFLSRVKSNKTYTLLPFGPALIFAGFIILFLF